MRLVATTFPKMGYSSHGTAGQSALLRYSFVCNSVASAISLLDASSVAVVVAVGSFYASLWLVYFKCAIYVFSLVE